VFLLLLCSCAAGSESPTAAELVAPEVPAQQAAPDYQDDNYQSNCVVDKHLSSNCIVTVVLCQEEIKSIEVKCDRGRKLFIWEYIPDPPNL